jgi:hypothetical protein
MAGPRLLAERLIRLNRSAAAKTRRRILAAAGYGAALALLWAEREWFAQAIDWLNLHSLICGGLAAMASAVQVARRRALTRVQFARSWLAAVPIPASARWEALWIESFPATAALIALLIMGLSCALVFALSHASHGGTVLAVWGTLSIGVAVGAAAGHALPAPKPADLPPGSRYVPHQKSRRAAKIRPSLSALGAWPVRQMFAWAQPKVVARTTVPIMVMLPLGTTADRAMSVLAVAAVSGALVLLCVAVVSISRHIWRWTAPLPLRTDSAMRAMLLPTLGVMIGASSLESLLLLTFDVSYRPAAAAGLATAVIGCLAALIGTQTRRFLSGRTP